MRSTLLTILASSAVLVSAAEIDRNTVLDSEPEVPLAIGKPECVYNAIRESNIDCDVQAVLECFEVETKKEILDRIQQCLLSSGCISKESVDESYIWADICRPVAEIEAEEQEYKELRIRADTSTSSSASASTASDTTTTSASTTSDTSTTSSSSTTSTSASAAATTTVASSTTSSSSTTTSGSTLSTSTTSSTSSTSSSSSITSAPSSCFDYSTSSTSACWVTSGSETCTPTTATASSCATGMYCTTDSAGGDICMKKDDKLTTSGIAVAIVFGTAVGTFFITIISCAVRDSRATSRRRKAMEASLEAEAKTAGVALDMEAAKRRGSRISPGGGKVNRSRSPMSAPLLSDPNNLGGDGDEDARNLLSGSRQPSPNPTLQGQRSLTGGSSAHSPAGSGPSSPSSPSRSEEGAYHEARR